MVWRRVMDLTTSSSSIHHERRPTPDSAPWSATVILLASPLNSQVTPEATSSSSDLFRSCLNWDLFSFSLASQWSEDDSLSLSFFFILILLLPPVTRPPYILPHQIWVRFFLILSFLTSQQIQMSNFFSVSQLSLGFADVIWFLNCLCFLSCA